MPNLRQPIFYGRAGITVLVLILTATVINSLNIGLSSVYNEIAKTELERWPLEPRRIPGEWSIVESNLSMSKKLYAENPAVLSNLGRLYQYKELSIALDYYNEARESRPSYALNWALIAQIKSVSNEIDQDFSNALSNAAYWGPWEPNVQFLAVSAGIRAWPLLNREDRLLIRETAVRGMKSPRNLNHMGRLLKNAGFLPLVCPHLPRIKRYATYCKIK